MEKVGVKGEGVKDGKIASPTQEPHAGASSGKVTGPTQELQEGASSAEVADPTQEPHAEASSTMDRITLDKQRLAKKKAAKRAAAKQNKMNRLRKCMKRMNVEMHPGLVGESYMADVARAIGTTGARVVLAEHMPYPEVLLWSRSDSHGHHQRQASLCDYGFFIIPAQLVAEILTQGECALSAHVASVRSSAACPRRLKLVVFGSEDYIKYEHRALELPDWSPGSVPRMTEDDLQAAVSHLMRRLKFDAAMVETTKELADLIVAFTTSLAEEPPTKPKHAREDDASSKGEGVKKTFHKMLKVLPGATPEAVEAICKKFKAPRTLMKALQASTSAVQDLADLEVAPSPGTAPQSRRVGPEFARVVNTFFTAEDGDTLLE